MDFEVREGRKWDDKGDNRSSALLMKKVSVCQSVLISNGKLKEFSRENISHFRFCCHGICTAGSVPLDCFHLEKVLHKILKKYTRFCLLRDYIN